MIKDDYIKWHDIKEMREGYFVTYSPAMPDFSLAHLRVVILSEFTKEKLVEILETEFSIWAKKYPVQLFATLSSDKNDGIDLQPLKNTDVVTGHFDPVKKQLFFEWGLKGSEGAPEVLKDPQYIRLLYKDLPHKTATDIRKNIAESNRQAQLLNKGWKIYKFFELLIWPPVKGIFAFPLKIKKYVSNIWEFVKLDAGLPKSEKEKKKESDELRKRHILYHVARNPMGFERLKAENFEKETKERILKEAEEVQKQASAN